MLLLLFIWLYLFLLSFIFGSAYPVLSNKDTLFNLSINMELNCTIGINILMTVLAICSIFTPINLFVHIFIGITALLFLAFRPKRWKNYWIKQFSYNHKSIYVILGSLLWGTLLLVQSVKIPFWTDVAGYHAQAIQWIEQYAVVPGLANLHSRYGFNPHAHLLSAFANVRFLGWGPIYAAFSSFLLLLMGTFLIRKIVYENTEKRFIAISTLAFLLLFYRDWISSPNPDIFCTVFTLFIGYTIYYAQPSYRLLTHPYIFFALIFLMFSLMTTKLSTFTVLFFAPFLFYYSKQTLSVSTIGKLGLLWCIVFIPFFIRNYYLSGYLVYPFKAVDLFNVDWKVPLFILEDNAAAVKNFAKMASYDHAYVESLSFFEWFPYWLQRRAFFEYPLLLLMLLNPVIVLFLGIKARNKKHFITNNWLALLSFLCCVVWFMLAPYFRFAHGFILMATLLPLALLINHCPKGLIQRLAKFVTIISLITTTGLISYSLYRECQELQTASFNYWTAIEQMPTPTVYHTTITGKPIVVAQNEHLFCWDYPLPCTPKLLPGVACRGEEWQDGFLFKKYNKSNLLYK